MLTHDTGEASLNSSDKEGGFVFQTLGKDLGCLGSVPDFAVGFLGNLGQSHVGQTFKGILVPNLNRNLVLRA